MQYSTVTIFRIFGLASLTVLATSVPESARPVSVVSVVDRPAGPARALPSPAEAPGRRASDPVGNQTPPPVCLITVDLGNVWYPEATDHLRRTGSRSTGPTDLAKLPRCALATDRPMVRVAEPVHPATGPVLVLNSEPRIVMPTRWSFLSEDRSCAPPRA
jgi:hypothetical protein